MKEIIDISEETYALIKNNELLSNSSYKTEIWEAINNGIPFFKNATNGDVIKSLFPNYTYIGTCILDKYENILMHDINYNWWNAPYKAESEDKE